jgi:hypothetical protein
MIWVTVQSRIGFQPVLGRSDPFAPENPSGFEAPRSGQRNRLEAYSPLRS